MIVNASLFYNLSTPHDLRHHYKILWLVTAPIHYYSLRCSIKIISLKLMMPVSS